MAGILETLKDKIFLFQERLQDLSRPVKILPFGLQQSWAPSKQSFSRDGY